MAFLGFASSDLARSFYQEAYTSKLNTGKMATG